MRHIPVKIAALLFALAAVPCQAADAPVNPPATQASPVPLSASDQKLYQQAFDLIQIYSGTGDHLERAYKMLVDIAKRNPTSGYPYAGLAEIRYRLLDTGVGAPQEIIALAQEALRLDPRNADAYVVLSKAALRQGNIGMAIDAADKAIAIAPDKPEALFVKAQLAVRSGSYAAAEKLYLRTIELLPHPNRKANIYSWLGQLYASWRPINVPAAIDAYEKSIELATANSPWRLTNVSGFLVQHTDRYDQAIGYLERVLKNGDSPRARRYLGLAHFSKWGEAYLNPGKSKNSKVQVLQPPAITKLTGVTPELSFVEDPVGRRPPVATLALLKAGLIKDVDVRPTGSTMTALIAAAYGNHLDLVRALIDRGANVNAVDQDDEKNMPIFYAINNHSFEMVKLLVEKGARINVADGAGIPLINRAISIPILDRKSDFRSFEYLLSRGADPAIPDRQGQSTVAYVVTVKEMPAARLLFNQHKADPNGTGPDGMPLLLLAAQRSTYVPGTEMVSFLLESGANPWAKHKNVDILYSVGSNYPAHALIRKARETKPRPSNFGIAFGESVGR